MSFLVQIFEKERKGGREDVSGKTKRNEENGGKMETKKRLYFFFVFSSSVWERMGKPISNLGGGKRDDD